MVVKFDNVSKAFGKTKAVNDVSFSVSSSDFFVLLGPNGSGKTTTVRLMTGLLQLDNGKISLFDEELVYRNSDKLRASIGVQTDGALYERLTARKNLEMWGELYGLSKQESMRRSSEMLDYFDLQKFADKPVSQFSKGMKQQVAISRALLHKPKLLILDEPTAGLDPQKSEKLIKYLKKMQKETNTTIFMCTHNLNGLENLVDKVGIMFEGNMIICGDVNHLIKKYWSKIEVKITASLNAIPYINNNINHIKIISKDDNNVEFLLECDDVEEIPSYINNMVSNNIKIYSILSIKKTLRDLYFHTINSFTGGSYGKEKN